MYNICSRYVNLASSLLETYLRASYSDTVWVYCKGKCSDDSRVLNCTPYSLLLEYVYRFAIGDILQFLNGLHLFNGESAVSLLEVTTDAATSLRSSSVKSTCLSWAIEPNRLSSEFLRWLLTTIWKCEVVRNFNLI